MLRHSLRHILESSGDLRAVQELLGMPTYRLPKSIQVRFSTFAKVYDKSHPHAKEIRHENKSHYF